MTSESFSTRPLIRSVYAPSLLHAIGFGMLGPAIPLFAQHLGMPLALIGLLVALRGMGGMLADVPAGFVAARLGGRRGMAIGLATSAVAGLALGISQTPAHLFVAMPLVGIGLATWLTCRLTYVADEVPLEQRGLALAQVGGFSRIGLAVGPIVGGLLGTEFGIQAAFLGYAAIGFAALALVLVGSRRRRRGAEVAGGAPHRDVLRLVWQGRRAIGSAAGVAVSLTMLRSARQVLVPLWGAWLGLDLAEIGLVIGLASAFDMTLFRPVGMVMDRRGRKWTIVPCLLVLASSLLLFPSTTGFASFLAVALLGGVGNGLGSGAVMTMGSDLAPARLRGEFIGLWRLVCDSGAVAAPAIVGALAQAVSLAAAFVASAGIGVVGAALMVALVPEGLKRRAGSEAGGTDPAGSDPQAEDPG